MKRRLLVAALGVAVLALVVPTGALPMTEADTVGGEVVVRPGADSPYAHLGDDGEVVIDITAENPRVDAGGVNGDGRTYLSGVLQVRNAGEGRAQVWITHPSSGVTFTARSRHIGAAPAAVILAPNESVGVGLIVDTTAGSGPRVRDFRIHARLVGTGASGGERTRSSTPRETGGNDASDRDARGTDGAPSSRTTPTAAPPTDTDVGPDPDPHGDAGPTVASNGGSGSGGSVAPADRSRTTPTVTTTVDGDGRSPAVTPTRTHIENVRGGVLGGGAHAAGAVLFLVVLCALLLGRRIGRSE